MSAFMEINTELPHGEVVEHFRRGHIESVNLDSLRLAADGCWCGTWEFGDFSIERINEEQRLDLKQRFNLPLTLKTRIWITTDELYEGQTGVYLMAAEALKNWEGDLAVLNNGDYLRVQRVAGHVSLREDCLNPERLVFYNGIKWSPLPGASD